MITEVICEALGTLSQMFGKNSDGIQEFEVPDRASSQLCRTERIRRRICLSVTVPPQFDGHALSERCLFRVVSSHSRCVIAA